MYVSGFLHVNGVDCPTFTTRVANAFTWGSLDKAKAVAEYVEANLHEYGDYTNVGVLLIEELA
jgi:hypothetical protein